MIWRVVLNYFSRNFSSFLWKRRRKTGSWEKGDEAFRIQSCSCRISSSFSSLCVSERKEERRKWEKKDWKEVQMKEESEKEKGDIRKVTGSDHPLPCFSSLYISIRKHIPTHFMVLSCIGYQRWFMRSIHQITQHPDSGYFYIQFLYIYVYTVHCIYRILYVFHK